MALAFNVLVPRGRRWLLVLALGNLTIFGLGENTKLPGYQSYEVSGPREMQIESGGNRVEAIFFVGWHSPERSRGEYWRWSRGDAEIIIINPHKHPLVANVSFGLRSKVTRQVVLRGGGSGEDVLWSGNVGDELTKVKLHNVVLAPGKMSWSFSTDKPAQSPNLHDPRPVAFSLRNLEIRLRGWAE